ncbi:MULTISPECIES: DegT/DnrJ/EryC1/StrS aminotransferase family protein [unclassified Ruminococcus]|uniref:DegT/DnrJ/EryC1/StrS family aminotransferase n=1 Tax=unclassified Ruminococcus TaxID=2608920 RepID=UPI00210D7CE0|nr:MULTISPECIES: DegT/DnrJ/EryC1/StrS family aminotransferase [unclassified Ruminococcus]MCQ4022954.1 aminotransferase class I/II-fold pyridoxal phosphate-dependent enzyme [Ruminococcus sp. zg-924]MCQ4115348.1 aminotransferase class I/II-fold pyridoxal phosphate-dependent enzyme [Ruminococcus sp. zg-921]
MKAIPFSPPDITDEEINEVVRVLKSGWITTGMEAKTLEKKVSEYVGTDHTVCFNSWTAAMELTLRMLGIGEGDEVITTAYTYTASASVVKHVGAKLVLADTAPDSFLIDCDSLEGLINERTKAIIPVNIGGKVCDQRRIMEIIESKRSIYKPNDANPLQKAFGRVVILSDSAHGLGATRYNIPSGRLADFTAFSFHAVKNLTTAEGGSVTWQNIDGIDNDELERMFRVYSLHGQTKDAFSKMQLGAWEYDIIYPAYKCNMPDVLAAIGVKQLERYDKMLNRRHEIIKMYNDVFLPMGLKPMIHSGKDFRSSGHLYLLRIPGYNTEKRNALITKLAEQHITTNVHYKPLPLLSAYKNLGFDIKDFPNAYHQYENEITLPLHTLLTDEDVMLVANSVKSLI